MHKITNHNLPHIPGASELFMEREKEDLGNGSLIRIIAHRLKIQDLIRVEPEIHQEFLINFAKAEGDERLRRKEEEKLDKSIENLQQNGILSPNEVYTIMAKEVIRRQIKKIPPK